MIKKFEKKYVSMGRTDIYAVCYAAERIIYYNLDFRGTTQLIIFK